MPFLKKLIVLFPLCLLPALALDLHVAPDGSDAWSGTLARPNATRSDGPLASLRGARDVLRRRDHSREAVNVIVAGGNYALTAPLELGPEDSGSAEFPVTYRAAAEAKPVFSGGRVITGWKKEANGLWSAPVPEVAAGEWFFEQLWVNGRRATRARDPNRGFFRVESVGERPLAAAEAAAAGAPENWTRQTIGLKETDRRPLAAMPTPERDEVQIVAYHYWETTRRFLTGFDSAEGTLTFDALPKHSYAGIRIGTRYHLENALAYLDAPGEWFLDRGGKLYYRPRRGENMKQAEVVAPRLETFLVLKGDAAAGRWVEHVAFQGLAFRYSQWLTPPDGVRPFQAAIMVDAVMMMDGARHIALADCEIAHLGKHALWLRRGCQAIRVNRCLLRDLGAGGIRIGEETRPADGAERTAGIEIDNNIIAAGGRILASAVGIWVGQSSENRITHNDISDFYYTGISVGWQWGYAESTASGNRIDGNRVHHLGWGLMSDLGGIYTLGISPGTQCTGNVVHDIVGADYGGCGIYLDEGSSFIRVADNLVYATTHGALHQHYGEDNRVENNIFALNRDAQLRLTRGEPHRSLFFRHNLIYWKHGALFAKDWTGGNIESDENLYFRAGREALSPRLLAAAEPPGRDVHSLVADPGFRKPLAGDFTLAADSPARRIGFQPFDFGSAGVYGAPAWRQLAASLSSPALPDWAEQDPFAAP